MNTNAVAFLRRWGTPALYAVEGVLLGLAAGFVICCFRLCKDIASPAILGFLAGWREHWWIVPGWLLVLVAAARFLGFLVGKVPLISGSGIPQTELAASGNLHIGRAQWLKLLPAKFVGCLVSTLGGLSLGREGPCIQMGAAAASVLSGLWDHISHDEKMPVAVGAAAGMTAAFGAPVAGFLFVFEEMKSRPSLHSVIAVSFAVAASQFMTGPCFGFGLVFPFGEISAPASSELWTLPFAGGFMGLAGVAYCKALLGTKNAEALHTPLPNAWRILPPMIIAWGLAFVCPSVLGGGENLVAGLKGLTADPSIVLSGLVFVASLKIAFALFSYTGNVPGGILMPMLCVGALLGAVLGQAFLGMNAISEESWTSFLVCGMAGFFVAVVRAPLTGTVLVIEMSGSFDCLPGAAAVSFFAWLTANALKCPPVYDSLRSAIAVAKKSSGCASCTAS